MCFCFQYIESVVKAKVKKWQKATLLFMKDDADASAEFSSERMVVGGCDCAMGA